ncbi:hypothetical protein [Rubrivivax benzoatilyticus]|uniref:hypothetical protein n=1 Tax=Rubrivivax benzoatilyticus TaxID=316997 RepID=UPI0011102789|nr:hypothetical protein [Rubrivivax benzoatilyticus]NHL23768.1 hypothetical protein [Rubrivivax benzoatilyticus]
MIRVPGSPRAAVVSLAFGASCCLAAPATGVPDTPPAAPGPSASTATAGGIDVVPGASQTIRLLLELQNGQPQAATGSDGTNPARARPQDSARSGTAAVMQEPQEHDVAGGHTEAAAEPSTQWTGGPAGAGGEPSAAPAPSPVRSAEPSAVRRAVAYLREHRLQVFVGGLIVLAVAAIGTVVSARQRSARARRRVTADPVRPTRHRRPQSPPSR